VLYEGDQLTVHQSDRDFEARAEAAADAGGYLERTFGVDDDRRHARSVMVPA
jgi:hypothetical protein